MSRYLVVAEIKSDTPLIHAETEAMADAREVLAELDNGKYQILKIMTEPITVSRETKVVITGGETTSPRKRKE